MNTSTLSGQNVASRLPNSGTTIFSVMSALAKSYDAINLGQGFPDFGCDPALMDAVNAAMRESHNQYPLMTGVAELRRGIAEKIAALYGHPYDADTEITITAGATQGIFTTILSCVHPGDEVVVLEPAYDSYIPAILLAGGTAKTVPLAVRYDGHGRVEGYDVPFDGIAEALSKRTRLIIINTPHNPTATVWREADMQRLAKLLEGTNVLLCSDEVYEHIIFDGARHESAARYPALRERGFVVSSFGKSYHVTGWKVGYVAAPAWLMREFRKVHQFNVFTVNAPMQHGIAAYMQDAANYLGLPGFYQRKRDYFLKGLLETGLRPLVSEGTYFQCVDYSRLALPEARLGEQAFAEWMTREIGVASIPVSAFYSTPRDLKIIRFCFAKQEKTLEKALSRLRRLK